MTQPGQRPKPARFSFVHKLVFLGSGNLISQILSKEVELCHVH